MTNLASLLFGFALFASLIGTASYVQAPASSGYGFGSSIVVAGLCLLPSGLLMLLFAPVAARLIGSIGAHRTLSLGAIIVAAGWLERLVATGSLWEVIVGSTIVGAGTGIGYASMPALINANTPSTELAAANGLNSLARSLGSSLASAIGGSLLTVSTIVIAGAALPSLAAYRSLFAICAAVAVLAAVAALFVPPQPRLPNCPAIMPVHGTPREMAGTNRLRTEDPDDLAHEVCQHESVDVLGGDSYRSDLAVVHHLGNAHAAACAPGIVKFLAPVRARQGLVLELGCGTGLLTRELVAAGHRVIATDAAPAMLDIARELVGGLAQDVRQLTLPDDPLPQADAIVAVGHPLNYLPDAVAIDRALIAMAAALRPGGLLAFDVCDLEWPEPAAIPRISLLLVKTGRSLPSSRYPPRTGSSVTSRPSCPTRTDPGAGILSTTRMCS